jgi:hypothetical protein
MGNEISSFAKMSLPELLAYSTVQVRTIATNGQQSSGTGFIVNFYNSPTNYYPMIVSNKHVFDGANKIQLAFTVCGTNGYPTQEIYHYEASINDLHILRHPVNTDDSDVCALPIAHIYQAAMTSGKKLMVFPLRLSDVSIDPLARASAPLSQLVMIGYPAGMRDTLNNQPIFRTGIAATNPRLDYEGKKIFFVDMAVFPGSSGSPVILYNDGSLINPYTHSITIDGQPRYVLLGIVSQQYHTKDSVNYVNPNIANSSLLSAQINVPLNLGLVIKVERILELQHLFFEELRQ